MPPTLIPIPPATPLSLCRGCRAPISTDCDHRSVPPLHHGRTPTATTEAFRRFTTEERSAAARYRRPRHPP